MADRDDIRTVHFRDPTSKGWHRLESNDAAQIDAPFSAGAAASVRAIGAHTCRHVDPQQAVEDLRADWTAGEGKVTAADARKTASMPGVVDLLSGRKDRAELPDDLDDVFTRHYTQHPDSDGLEVFDE